MKVSEAHSTPSRKLPSAQSKVAIRVVPDKVRLNCAVFKLIAKRNDFAIADSLANFMFPDHAILPKRRSYHV